MSYKNLTLNELLEIIFNDKSLLTTLTLEELVNLEPHVTISDKKQCPEQRIEALQELIKRSRFVPPKQPQKISGTKDAAEYFIRLLGSEKVEYFYTMNLDSKLNVISVNMIGKGDINKVICNPREIFAPAITDHAAAIIIAHNHPSGEPTPSKDDMSMFETMKKAGKIIGIDICDNIIVGQGKYYSQKEEDTKWLNSS